MELMARVAAFAVSAAVKYIEKGVCMRIRNTISRCGVAAYFLSGMLGIPAAFLSSPARAEFLLGAGDVVEVSVAGIPALATRATIDLDGKVTLPIVGNISASGISIDALRGRVQAEYSKRAVSLREPDGRTTITPVSPEEVTVNVAQYRPVYISGDLARVGEVAFRPGLTVRQAVAVAGGYDVVRFRINNPYMDAIDFKAQETSLLDELKQEEEKKKYLQAELDRLPEKINLDEEVKVTSPPQPQNSGSLISEQIRAQTDDYEREISHLRGAFKQLAMRASLLDEQKSREEEGSLADNQEFERAKALLEKGTTSTQRVTDARRAMLLSATRALQTGAEASQVRMALDEMSRTLQRRHDERRIRLLTELQESRTKFVRLQAQLAAARQKLGLVGGMKSMWSNGRTGEPEIVVYRNANGKEEKFVGSEATPLVPGDVVEVALHVD